MVGAQCADPTRCSVVLYDGVPIHHVPPSFKVIGAAVLVLEIVGVLPDVDTEDRRVAIHQGTVLIWRRNNFELSILVFNQPRPAAAKTAHASSSKFLFEFVKAAERGFDIIGEFAFRFAAG